MKSETFKLAFEEIQNRIELPKYLNAICLNLSIGLQTDIKTVNNILDEYSVNYSVAKVEFLHLIFEFIRLALEDNVLTNDEKFEIIYLKKVFKIQPGDFYIHNRLELGNVITYQLSKIYKDNFVTPEEALLKVDIQELFDLTYDQMNEYSKKEAIVSIQQGADVKDLDVFFTHTEYFKLKSG